MIEVQTTKKDRGKNFEEEVLVVQKRELKESMLKPMLKRGEKK